MILSKTTKLKVSTSNKKNLTEKGYTFKINDIIEIKVSDLSIGSHAKILVKCDICGKEKEISYQSYLRSIKKYNLYTCSSKCSRDKAKQTNLEKFGVEYSQQNKEVREKYKKTCLKRFGVENPNQSEKIKEKKKETCLKNFGVEYPEQSEIVREKKKQTCLKRYGCESYSQTNEYKEKIKHTNLERFGVESSNQSEIVKEKKKQTCLEHFGVENPQQNKEIKEKSKQTCLERYGYEYPFQNEEIMNKIIKTQIERYGELWLKYIPKYNPNSIIYLDMISEKLNIPIQHALNGGEKKIVRYWIDGYIEQYNICIEWDEPRHNNNKEYDKLRETYIKENKNCKFVRINEEIFIKDIEKGISDTINKINEII